MLRLIALILISCTVADGADAPFGVDAAVDVMVAMRDGVKLATDIYRPTSKGQVVSDGRSC